jgi:hypothetical protein
VAVNLQEVAYSLYPLKDLPYVCIDKKDRQAVMFLLNIYGFSDPGRADGQLITYSKQRRRRAQWILRSIEQVEYQLVATLSPLVRNQRVGGSIPPGGHALYLIDSAFRTMNPEVPT